nr:zinc ribbon domain-containing protein [Prevotella sp.]
MPMSKRISILLLLMFALMSFSSCYHKHSPTRHAAFVQYNEKQLDSLSFFTNHHYTNGYNFVVKSDSIFLMKQQPEELISGMLTDSFCVKRNSHLVVADIRMVPQDKTDSVWVQLATEKQLFGWIHESNMLPKVVPDDPISEFISTFSDTHLLIFLIVIVVMGTAYFLKKVYNKNGKIVHFNDIDSFYPTFLCLIVASSATLYASVQVFSPEVWRQFYFHPTLNPFSVPLILSVFLISIWSMLIVGLAVIDDVRHQLPFGEAVLYLLGLAAVCAVDYIIFSIGTLYFVGYILLVAYFWLSLKCYNDNHHPDLICGNCGARLKEKGVCPNCGAVNK